MTAANDPMAWADQGICRGDDQDLFYPAVPPHKITAAHVGAVRPICQACPVFTSCHAHAVRSESDGIWAATSPKDRRRLRKAMGLPDMSKTVEARSPDVAVGLVPDVAELTADGAFRRRDRLDPRHRQADRGPPPHRSKEDRMTCTRKPTPPPPDQPRTPTGAVDVRALCAQLDAAANVGAGKPRPR